MTLQHAKAIKIVLSLRCQKEKNMKKKECPCCDVKENKLRVMFKLVIFGFTWFATVTLYCQYIMEPIHLSHFLICAKRNIQKENDGTNWRVFTAQ